MGDRTIRFARDVKVLMFQLAEYLEELDEEASDLSRQLVVIPIKDAGLGTWGMCRDY